MATFPAATILFFTKCSLCRQDKKTQRDALWFEGYKPYVAAMKSSKTLICMNGQQHSLMVEHRLTLRSLIPALCHSSPNSLPPRMFGRAKTAPYDFKKVRIPGLNDGLIEMLNPPYPARVSTHISSKHETKLTVLNSWRGTVFLGALVPYDEHWNLGPILGLVPHLFRTELVGLETFHLCRAVYAPRRFHRRCGIEFVQIDASNDTRIGEACHRHKEVREGTATKHLGGSNKRWFDARQFFAGYGIEVYFINDLTCLWSVRGY